MIEVVDLVKQYKTTKALQGVRLTVESNELFAYLGPNGAGKTTTIRILTGLTRPDAGKALLDGRDVARDPLAAKKRFGLVPQHINLDSELTVYESLYIHGRLHHMRRREIVKRIDWLLDYIGLGEERTKLIRQLSGGMKRRVLIARALLHHPTILFLDEPTVGLDAAIRRRIWALIKKVQQDGVTIFLTTHYIEEAEFLADRVAFIDQGRIVIVDTPANLTAGIGNWAVDTFQANRIQSFYFKTRQEAEQWAGAQENEFTLRRVNLEDAFLALTGKKVG